MEINHAARHDVGHPAHPQSNKLATLGAGAVRGRGWRRPTAPLSAQASAPTQGLDWRLTLTNTSDPERLKNRCTDARLLDGLQMIGLQLPILSCMTNNLDTQPPYILNSVCYLPGSTEKKSEGLHSLKR